MPLPLLAVAGIGAGVSALGSVLCGIFGSSAARKRRKMLEGMQRENQDWYDRKYNEDATQRADAMNLIQRTEDMMKKRAKASAGRSAMMGGGDEVAARDREAGAETVGRVAGQINADNERRKENIEQHYQTRKQALDAGIAQVEAEKDTQIANAVQGIAGAAGNFINSMAGNGEEKKS